MKGYVRPEMIRSVLRGERDLLLLASVLIGASLGTGMFLIYPLDDVFNPVPESASDWVLTVVFVTGPTLIAVLRGGLLGCWLIDLPPLAVYLILELSIVITHAPGVYSVGTVVPAVVIAVVVAFLYAALGYVVGRGLRAAGRRVSAPHGERAH
jgi:hypothetical protein